MTIGERIKNLRKKNDITQEKLADYLCVSYQAVSKWECGVSNPDITLIGPLARLFNVTADELLGVTKEETDIRWNELEKAYNDTFKTGDIPARMKIAEAAVKEYPGNMEWLNNYAWDIWCMAVGGLVDSEVVEQYREKAIKLFDTVIENTDNDEIKAHAISGIVKCLCGKGCKKEAKKYVDLFPEVKFVPSQKETLLGMCLEGEEQIIHKQNYAEGQLETLIRTLLWDNISENKYTCPAAEAIIKAAIPDGNYFNYNYDMSHIQFRKAEMEAKAGNFDSCIELLAKAVYHAKQYDILDVFNPGEYTYTAPLFNRLTYDSRNWCHAGDTTLLDDIKQMCGRSCFDPIRDTDSFKAIFD